MGRFYSEADGQKHLEAYTALELGFCKPNLPCALDDELRIVCAMVAIVPRIARKWATEYLLANGGREDG